MRAGLVRAVGAGKPRAETRGVAVGTVVAECCEPVVAAPVRDASCGEAVTDG